MVGQIINFSAFLWKNKKNKHDFFLMLGQLLPDPYYQRNCMGLMSILVCLTVFCSAVPEHKAYLINWPTSLSGQQFRAFTCSCPKNPAALLNVLAADSRWSTGAVTAALNPLASSALLALSWAGPSYTFPQLVCWWDWKDMETSWVSLISVKDWVYV